MIVKLGRMVACLALANLALAQPNSDKLPDPGTLPANGQLSLAMYPTFEGDVLVRPNCQYTF